MKMAAASVNCLKRLGKTGKYWIPSNKRTKPEKNSLTKKEQYSKKWKRTTSSNAKNAVNRPSFSKSIKRRRRKRGERK
jgi:hypothetical protein